MSVLGTQERERSTYSALAQTLKTTQHNFIDVMVFGDKVEFYTGVCIEVFGGRNLIF